ncbi:ricin-type beta-trefoil lectin domain protein [Streptomyces goshikiensis]|uniref:ricin-type beta-trefoil lectin domain protein n=1 Tax=Streptomyces goshikiensis TaxID=1942 RepID=UPI0033245834
MAVVAALTVAVAPVRAQGSGVRAVPGHPSATWNMQGANAAEENKWTTGVNALLNRGVEVIALQEAGQVPRSAALLATHQIDENGVTYNVPEYRWGSSRSRSYIYFLQTDPNGNRVNLAIVTRQQVAANRIFVLQPQADNTAAAALGRPSLGIQLADNSVFWNAHARSYGNNARNDAGHIVGAVNTRMNANNVLSWALLADFNRTPPLLTGDPSWPAPPVRVVNSDQPTQQSGNELDYMVTNDATHGFMAARAGGVVSDHYPVRFGFNLQAAATASGRMFLTRDPERCATVAGDVQEGSRARRTSCADVVEENWTFQGEGQIEHQGKCLEAGYGGDPTLVTVRRCDQSPDQWWKTSPDGTLHNDGSDLCLSGGNAANGYQLTMSPDCSASNASEVWTLPAPTGPIRAAHGAGPCVAVSQGAALSLTGCKPGEAKTQTWTFDPDGTVRAAGKCLTHDSTQGDDALSVTSCDPGPAQRWVFQADGILFHPESQRCAEATTGTSVTLRTCEGSQKQQWLRSTTVGTIRTVNESAACFFAPTGEMGSGARAHLFGCDRPLISPFSTDLDWTFSSNGTIRQGARCLDDDFVTSWATWTDCDGSESQRWDLTQGGASLPGGLLVSRADGRCLDTVEDALRLSDDCGSSRQWVLNGTTARPDKPQIAGLESELKIITNGRWKDRMLCASPRDDSAWLGTLSSDDRYCQWIQFSLANGTFVLYNPQKGKVMSYKGGDGGPLVMENYNASTQQYFALGGMESWKAQALQSVLDRGQNVDAKAPGADSPRTDAVHTRGWRHGDRMELTWNINSVPGTTMVVNGEFDLALCASMSDSGLWIQGDWSYCWWNKVDLGDHFILYNPQKGQVMAYEGGDGGPVVMENYSPAGRNQQYFSVGSEERWGNRALQSYLDSGQNVDARATDGDRPRTDAVHTRGWRHGDTASLTWAFDGSLCRLPWC